MTAFSAASPRHRAPSSTRSVSRISNLLESYVYPHSAVHPLTLPDCTNPPFIVTPYRDRSSVPGLYDPSPSSPSSSASRGRCTPSLPSSVLVDPTGNGPASFWRLFRGAASSLQGQGVGEVRGRREAGWQQEEEHRRREEETQRVLHYRKCVHDRLRAYEKRRRQEAEERTRALPLALQQLVYGRRPHQEAEQRTEQKEAARPPLRVRQLQDSIDEPQTTACAAQSTKSVVAASSRAEEAAYALRIRRLASHRERQEALRVRALTQRRLSRRQSAIAPPIVEAPPAPPPPPSLPRRPSRRRVFHPMSVPSSPRSALSPGPPQGLWDALQLRLSRLNAAVAPLCRCSEGGGQGVGRGVPHREGCRYRGDEAAYALTMLRCLEELERVRGIGPIEGYRDRQRPATAFSSSGGG